MVEPIKDWPIATNHLNLVLLVRLIEECGEVIQAASKALRFGDRSWPTEDSKTNMTKLRDEIADLVEAIRMAGLLPEDKNQPSLGEEVNRLRRVIAESIVSHRRSQDSAIRTAERINQLVNLLPDNESDPIWDLIEEKKPDKMEG